MASTLRNWLEKRAELLIVGAFSVAFIVGFALFAATGSLELAAAAIGIGAIGVPALLRQILPSESVAKDTLSFESRLKFLETAHQTSEVRLLALENKAPPVTVGDIDRLAIKIGALERRLTSIDLKIQNQPQTSLTTPLAVKKPPLDEVAIHKSLSSGKIKIESVEIESRMTGRLAYRFIVMKCDDKNGIALSEAELREAEISVDAIKFFDRVRVALTYNMALQEARNLEAPIHLCPIGKEILSDPQGIADIRSVMEKSPSIKNKIGFIFPSEPLDHASLRLPVLMKSLQQAGFLVGLNLNQELIASPSDLVRLNPNFVMLSGELMVEVMRKPSDLSIHPADLIALFERGGIDMIAVNLTVNDHVKAAETLGIHFAEKSATRKISRSKPVLSNKAQNANTDLRSIFEDHHAEEVMRPIELRPASLRERLQRRSA